MCSTRQVLQADSVMPRVLQIIAIAPWCLCLPQGYWPWSKHRSEISFFVRLQYTVIVPTLKPSTKVCFEFWKKFLGKKGCFTVVSIKPFLVVLSREEVDNGEPDWPSKRIVLPFVLECWGCWYTCEKCCLTVSRWYFGCQREREVHQWLVLSAEILFLVFLKS